jgi:hypothetical protein
MPIFLDSMLSDIGETEESRVAREQDQRRQSPLFMKLVEDVARAQEAEEDEQIVLDPQASNAFQVAINQTVLPVLQAMQQRQQYMQRQQLQMQQQMLLFMNQQRQPASVPHQLPVAAAAAMISPNHAPNPLLLPQLPRPRGEDILVRPNKDGNTVRKCAKFVNRIQASELLRASDGVTRVTMSNDNLSAQDYWEEFARGRNGNPPLRLLEAKGKGWRKAGVGGFRQAWSLRVPIYNLIVFFIEPEDVPGSPGLGMKEEAALEAAEPIYESVPVSKKTGRRSLTAVSKAFKKELLRRKAWWKYGKGPEE